MAQILIRGLDDEVVERLRDRAKKSGRSLAAEVRVILEEEAFREHRLDMKAARALIEDVRRRHAGGRIADSTELLREDRDR